MNASQLTAPADGAAINHSLAPRRLMRAILIDPWAMTVEEGEHDASDFQNIYSTLTRAAGTEDWPAHKVDCFCTAYGASGNVLKPGDALFVDDNGLLQRGPLRAFYFDGQPLVGRALILGSDSQGETAPAATPLADIQAAVTFGYAYGGE